MTLRYKPAVPYDWSYLSEGRYYLPIRPAAALFWLTALEVSGSVRWIGKAAIAVVGLCLFCVLVGEVKSRCDAPPDERLELVQEVRRLQARGGSQVLIARNVTPFMISADTSFVLISADTSFALISDVCNGELPMPHYFVGKEADLWVVTGPQKYRLSCTGALIARFHLQRAWTSNGGKYELYHARIRPTFSP